MQNLPNMEVLSFLNWIDINGYAKIEIGIPLDELFLNEKYYNKAIALGREYMHNNYINSRAKKSTYERYIDYILLQIKRNLLEKQDSYFYDFNDFKDSHYTNKFFSLLHNIVGDLNNSTFMEHLDAKTINNFSEGDLVNSVCNYLRYPCDPIVCGFFSSSSNSIAGITFQFLDWIHKKREMQNIRLRNIPTDVIERYIHEYVWYEYKIKRLTEKEKKDKENILHRTLVQQKNYNYIKIFLTNSHVKSTSIEEILYRSLNRVARYKCILLAEDGTFNILVRDYWYEMNTYSGDHIDIYYNESELLKKGWSTADKINIRARITHYPAIYIWEYAIEEGFCIPVSGLDSRDLMDVFKFMVDEIVKGYSLEELSFSISTAINTIIEAKNLENEKERTFTLSLLNACAKLQNNENWVRNTDENGRNTYIRDILTASGYFVNDQTLGGMSPTGKYSGELDLKIYDSFSLPFAIIEALNIKADHPCAWNRRYFNDHVKKLYTYDANGLSRNYLIIYATISDFERFCESISNQFSSKKCSYGAAEFIDVSPVETDFSDLRMFCARYLRTGRETRLYVLCVKVI